MASSLSLPGRNLLIFMALVSGSVAPAPALERVDYIAADSGDYFGQRLSSDLKEVFAGEGFDLVLHDARQDVDNQAALIAECATASEGPLIVTPVGDDSTAITHIQTPLAAILAARGFIIYGSVARDDYAERPQNSWYISSNPYDIGELQASYLLRMLNSGQRLDRNRNGIIDLALLNGELHNLNAEGRRKGFVEAIGAQIDYRMAITEFNAGWDGVSAEQMLGEYLKLNPEAVDVVVAANDEMALGAVRALQAAGFNRPDRGTAVIPVLGVDGLPGMLRAISRGEATATMWRDLRHVAEATLELFKILKSGVYPAPGEVDLTLDQEERVLWLPPHEPIDAGVLRARPELLPAP